MSDIYNMLRLAEMFIEHVHGYLCGECYKCLSHSTGEDASICDGICEECRQKHLCDNQLDRCKTCRAVRELQKALQHIAKAINMLD